MQPLNPYFKIKGVITSYRPEDTVIVPYITMKLGDHEKKVMSGIAYTDEKSAKDNHMWYKQETRAKIDLVPMKVIDFLKRRSKVSYSLNDSSRVKDFIESYENYHNINISENK